MTNKILWVTAGLNHYKARFLNHLATEKDVKLSILTGTGRDKMGDQELEEDWGFEHIKVDVSKKDFGNSKEVKTILKDQFINFNWVLIPAEKKNLPLFLFAMRLRKQHASVRLFSYNHAQLKSKNNLYSFLDRWLTKFFYKKLDRVVFYTESDCNKAIQYKLIAPEKAFWANNTVDNTEIEKYYNFQLPPEAQKTILFIGRLIPSKRIADVIAYYMALKPRFKDLKLDIIGDGPEQYIVKKAINEDANITWYGTLVDEAKIAPIMKMASLVFIPGLSGLSINHAFAYGRPYFTLKADKHGPEISYLDLCKNGYILEDSLEEDVKVLSSVLEDRAKLVLLCNNAKEKGEALSVQKWVNQLKLSLLNE